MQIKKSIKKNTRYYELTLNKEEAEELLSIDSEGVLSPRAKDGVRFHLFPSLSGSDKAFRLMPDQDGYFAQIGEISLRWIGDLEKLLNGIGDIPIEIPSSIKGNPPLKTGYVSIKINKGYKQKEQSQQ